MAFVLTARGPICHGVSSQTSGHDSHVNPGGGGGGWVKPSEETREFNIQHPEMHLSVVWWRGPGVRRGISTLFFLKKLTWHLVLSKTVMIFRGAFARDPSACQQRVQLCGICFIGFSVDLDDLFRHWVFLLLFLPSPALLFPSFEKKGLCIPNVNVKAVMTCGVFG